MGPANSKSKKQYFKHPDKGYAKLKRDIFKYQEKSVANLLKLLQPNWRWNNADDPWDEKLHENINGIPMWAQDESQYQSIYSNIDELIIEVSYQNYMSCQKQQELLSRQNIGGGYVIDFKNMVQAQINDGEKQRQIIRWDLQEKSVERSFSSSRFVQDQGSDIIFNDLENKDLKNKNEIIFNPNNYNFLKVKFDELNNGQNPSQKQIYDGVIQEMRNQLLKKNKREYNVTQEQINEAMQIHHQAWNFVFQCLQFDINNAVNIPQKNLEIRNSILQKSLLFLYSMDSFIYDVINFASRNKDESKVMSLGPITAALSQITLKAQYYRVDNKENENLILWRGIKIPQQEIDKFIEIQKTGVEKTIQFQGFQSTSEVQKVAYQFMRRGATQENKPVLLKIEIDNKVGFGLFKLDKQDYSLFPQEREVLLRDGHRYYIDSICQVEENDGFEYTLIDLKFKIRENE